MSHTCGLQGPPPGAEMGQGSVHHLQVIPDDSIWPRKHFCRPELWVGLTCILKSPRLGVSILASAPSSAVLTPVLLGRITPSLRGLLHLQCEGHAGSGRGILLAVVSAITCRKHRSQVCECWHIPPAVWPHSHCANCHPVSQESALVPLPGPPHLFLQLLFCFLEVSFACSCMACQQNQETCSFVRAVSVGFMCAIVGTTSRPILFVAQQ